MPQRTLNALLFAAYEWWLARRPPDWSDDRHLAEPWVNCTSDVDRALAEAVAAVVRKLSMEDLRKLSPR